MKNIVTRQSLLLVLLTVLDLFHYKQTLIKAKFCTEYFQPRSQSNSSIQSSFKVSIASILNKPNLHFQTNVSDNKSQFHGSEARPEILGPTRHCPLRQQAVQVRLPPVLMAGGRQGRPAPAPQAVRPPRRSLHRRPAPQTSRVV